MIEYMPTTNNEFKDGLRIQRDDWNEVIEALQDEELLKNERVKKAYDKAVKVQKRIMESLQD